MPLIGVRELKERTGEVLQKIQEERAEYIVTHHGKPVAMLLPVSQQAIEKAMIQAGRQSLSDSWELYARIAEQLRSQWPAGVKTEEVLKDIRR